jgi:RNA polymerase sigma-70 factor (ECF subfamily)
VSRSWIPLRAAIALSLVHPDDRRLAVALASLGPSSAPINRPGSGPRGFGAPPADRTDEEGSERIRALVDLARGGDTEAFGQLYDHYVTGVYRLTYYRLGSKQLAEDITAETFVRALRSISSFTWQGKDFGAWLTTIARNLITDHYKSSRQRLELVVDAVPERSDVGPGPEAEVLASLSSADLMRAVQALPAEQRDCVLMRFMEGLSIAETAQVLDRSEGAIKQLQLRAVRNLAKSLTSGS